MKTTISLGRSALYVACLSSMLILGGCASPVTHDAMVPPAPVSAIQHPQSVSVTATGGADTSAAGKPQISNTELQQAVAAAINQSKVFAQTVQGKNGDYSLNVSLFNLTQPSFGFSFTVGVEIGWTLTRVDTGAVVWQESIKSEHTTGAGEAFSGVARLKMATEGAVRDNIAKGLGKLSALKL
jgi:hypothetical protein